MKKIIYLFLILLILTWCNTQVNNSNIQNIKKDNNISQVNIPKENNITKKKTIIKEKNTSNTEKETIIEKEATNTNKNQEEDNQNTIDIQNEENNIAKINQYKILNKIKSNCFWLDYNKELNNLKLLPEEDVEKIKNYCDNLNKETLKNVEFFSNKQKKLEKLDLKSCNNKDCKFEIIFSKYNKKWCELINNDKNLYNECLKIDELIKKYTEINEWKKYYNRYYLNNF